jgi:hypothetical protein
MVSSTSASLASRDLHPTEPAGAGNGLLLGSLIGPFGLSLLRWVQLF